MFDKQTKRAVLVTAIGISLLAVLMNFSVILAFLGDMLGLIMPVIVGGMIAYFQYISF